jgi:hypothetical protein
MLSSPEVDAGEGDDKMTAERGKSVDAITFLNSLRSNNNDWRGYSGDCQKSLLASKPNQRICQASPMRGDFNRTYRLFTHFFQN